MHEFTIDTVIIATQK